MKTLTLKKSIDVNVPVSTAYDQWTQFEQFPEFMEGIKKVVQTDDTRLQWHAEIAGRVKSWEAEIFEQIPDQRIAWRSINGFRNSGTVIFTSLNAERSRITLQLEYEPSDILERLAWALGVVTSCINTDLRGFKDFIEMRLLPTGSWRGEIRGTEIHPPEHPLKWGWPDEPRVENALF